MNQTHILNNRLNNQLLMANEPQNAEDLVSYFGAIQAQDYAMSKWALGVRSGQTENVINNLINTGKIIRTHILRPTWHLVSTEDIYWMLELTSPQIKKICLPMCDRWGLDTQTLLKCNKIIESSLIKDNNLTREEIMSKLSEQMIPTNDIRSALIMMNAELESLVCNGIMRGKQLTYTLLNERVPNITKFSKEESLYKLANKYFTSHGPATINDFAWWSGLPMKDCRSAIESIKSNFDSFEYESKTYWFKENAIKGKKQNTIHLLPAFDEFLVSYKDRTASLPIELNKTAITANGIFKPVIVENGKVVGLWKREIKKNKAKIETSFFDKNQALSKPIQKIAENYATYLDMEVELG